MKKLPFLRLLFSAVPALGLFGAATSAHAQALALIANGSFEDDASGTNNTSNPTGGNVVDNSTFTDFRFFNVNTASGLSFTAQILNTNPDIGSNSLRLDVNNPGSATAGSYGFDIYNNQIAITPGTAYELTFAAAYIGGGTGLTTTVAEFNSSGAFVGEQFVNQFTLVSTDTAYHTYTVLFTPTVSTAATVDFTFDPGAGTATANALYIDDVQFGVVP